MQSGTVTKGKSRYLRVGGICTIDIAVIVNLADENAAYGFRSQPIGIVRIKSAFNDRRADIIASSLEYGLFRQVYTRFTHLFIYMYNSRIVNSGMDKNRIAGFKQAICGSGIDGQKWSLFRSWITVGCIGCLVVHMPHIAAKKSLSHKHNTCGRKNGSPKHQPVFHTRPPFFSFLISIRF